MAFEKKESDRDGFIWIIGRIGLVCVVVFVVLLLNMFPLRIGAFEHLRPALLLILVYYWAVTLPDKIPYLASFMMGIALDLLTGEPLGMSAMTLVLVHWIASAQWRFLSGQSFRVLWACFVLIAVGVAVLQWSVSSLFNGRVLDVAPVLASSVLTILVFPLMVPPLFLLNKTLSDPPRGR